METNFGQRLSRAREDRGLSIEEAAKALRLRPSHIEALEESNLAKFPNAAYAKSFLVMYSRFLKVDTQERAEAINTNSRMRVADFQYLTNLATEDKELKRAAQDARYDFVVPERGSRSWLPLIITGGVVLLVMIGFGVWVNLSRIGKSGDPASPAPPAVAPADAVAPVAPGTPAQAVAAVEVPPKPIVVTPSSASEGAVPEVGIPRARAISPVAKLAAADEKALAEIGLPAAPEPVVETPPAPVSETLPEDAGILLESKRKTWLVIREEPGGQPLYEDYLFPSAHPMRLPNGKYFIELKDANAVQIRKDGKALSYRAPGLLIE